MEIQSAKVDGGVNPIVEKLPFALQEKSLSVGSDYKLRHNAPFPPFDAFVEFSSQQARIINDPSFSFTSHADAPPKLTSWKQHKQKEISVHKTDVTYCLL